LIDGYLNADSVTHLSAGTPRGGINRFYLLAMGGNCRRKRREE
jgi:hypothetical protein